MTPSQLPIQQMIRHHEVVVAVWLALALAASFGCTTPTSENEELGKSKTDMHETEKIVPISVDAIGRPLVRGRVAGVEANIVIDTGASITALLASSAEKLGIAARPHRRPALSPGGGKTSIFIGPKTDISLGSVLFRRWRIFVFPDEGLRELEVALAVPTVDVVCGRDILLGKRGVLDFSAMELQFDPAYPETRKGRGRLIAPLITMPVSGLGDFDLVVQVLVDDVIAFFLVDTGANQSSIRNDSRLIHLLERKQRELPGWTIAGPTKSQFIHKAKVIAIGALRVSNVVFCNEVGESISARELRAAGIDRIDGRLGSAFFIENKLCIDLARLEIRAPEGTNANYTEEPAGPISSLSPQAANASELLELFVGR